MKVKELNTTQSTLLQELKTVLIQNFGSNIKDVILFGSQTTGKMHSNSDYDVLIVLQQDYDWKYKKELRYACYDISIKYDIFLDIKVVSINELQNTVYGHHPLFIHALQEGIYI